MAFSGDPNGAHVLLFPFPTAGHIIPLLDLANHLIINHKLQLTIVVTPQNLPLIHSIQTLVLPFPELPAGSSVAAKVRASFELHEPIVHWFRTHPSPPVAIISDFFLGWTHHLACTLGVPRIAFWPSGAFTSLVISHTWTNLEEIFSTTDENSLITLPNIPNSPVFPRWKVTTLSSRYKKGDPDWEFLRSGYFENTRSWGVLFNSCRAIEGAFIDRVKQEMGHDRVWAVGPLLPLDYNNSQRGGASSELMAWLDEKSDDSVVYVSFGSRAVLTRQQANVLATALDCSGVSFIWCLRVSTDDEGDQITEEYENRVAKRGLIIKGWAPQVAILSHRAVGVFLTHCGWNSVLEGISSNVLMLTWPMGADQFTSAELLVNELRVGIKACEGGGQDPVQLAQVLAESISGARREKEQMRKLHLAVHEGLRMGGSSNQDMHKFVEQLCQLQSQK